MSESWVPSAGRHGRTRPLALGSPFSAADTSNTQYSSIIKQHTAFEILKARTDQEIRTYLDLSDEELNAIIALRLFLRSAGNQWLGASIDTQANDDNRPSRPSSVRCESSVIC